MQHEPRAALASILALAALLLLPLSTASGEPPRLSVSVVGVQFEDTPPAYYTLSACIHWIGQSTGTGTSLVIDGTEIPVSPLLPVAFRPGWYSPDPGCLDLVMPETNTSIDVAVAATSGGSIVALSCNVTIYPIIYDVGYGKSNGCGSPQFTPSLSLKGNSTLDGTNATFSLNHTLSSRNFTNYRYQFRIQGAYDLWSDLAPTSSYTYGAANQTTNATIDAYRQANFTFTGIGNQRPRIDWRVRAIDAFTEETSPWSCYITLSTTESFTTACKQDNTGQLGEDLPINVPFVNVTRLGEALGIGTSGASLLIYTVLLGLFAGPFYAMGGTFGAVIGAALGTVLSYGFGIIPQWALIVAFFIGALLVGLFIANQGGTK